MALQFLFDPNTQFQNRNGVNNVGGFLRVYINGTDDRADTYCDFNGTLNEADIGLDTDGRAVVIVDNSKTYRIEVYDAEGALLWTCGNYTSRGGGGDTIVQPVSVEGTENEIDVTESEEGGIKHFVVSIANAVKTALSNIQSSITSLSLSLNGKKNVQTPSSFNGSTTKTLVGISQDANGEMSATFDDIAFPDWTSAINAAVATCENLENKKTTVTGFESSNNYYPTIKAVVDFVNGMLQNLGGKLITDNGDPFTSSASLPSSTPYGGVDIADKDYAYVQGVGTAERWSATVSGSSVTWLQEYAISIPVFTPSQQAAIDSGVTSAMLGTFLTKTGNGSDVTASFTAAVTRNNISTGEKLSVIFGKVAKWFSDLKSVAFSGSYNDLSDKPTIPTVNNGTLTIYRNGVSQGTFSANQSGLTGIDISVPTKTSQLVNDSFASVATSGSYNDLSNKPTIPEAATATPQPVSSSAGSTGSSDYFAKGDHVHKIVVGEGVNNGQVSIAGKSVSVKGWATKQDALPVGTTPTDTYAINISGTAGRANNATNDSQGYNIYQKYMRTSSGTKSLYFGSTTTIGSVNGSNVILSMPQANFISKDLDLATGFSLSVCQFVCHESVPPAGTWHRYDGTDVCNAFKTRIGSDWGISSTNYGGMANKAENDSSNRNIVNTYATKQELSDTATGLGNALHSSVSGIYDSMNRGCVRSAFDYESIAGKFTDIFSVKRESTSYVDAVVRLKVWGKYSYISAINDHTFCADITVQIRGESGSRNWTSAIADGCILYKGSTSSVSDLRVKMTTDSENRLYISILAGNATEPYTRMIVESNFMTNNSERCSFSNLVTIYGAGPAGRSALGAEFSLT